MHSTSYFLVGRLLDGVSPDVQPKRYLKVEGGIIREIGPVSALPPLSSESVVDLSAYCIAPVLIDCSVDLLQSSAIIQDDPPAAEQERYEHDSRLLAKNAGYTLSGGVRAVIDHSNGGHLLSRYFQNTSPAKRIVIKNCAQSCTEQKHDIFRIHFSQDIDHKQHPCSQAVSNREQCQALTSQYSTIIAVANGTDAVNNAIESGCHVIEQGYGMGRENLQKMADKGIVWIPSLLRAKNQLDQSSPASGIGCRFSQRVASVGQSSPEKHAFWQETLKRHCERVSFAQEKGVVIAVGTGAGQPGILHGESVGEEIKLLTKSGHSLSAALACACTNGALTFGIEELGPLTVGKHATFLATRGSASQLLRKLSFLEKTYRNGIQEEM